MTWHPRCGTSFLLVVMVISMIVYALLPVRSFRGQVSRRIVLLPVIAGVSYELIRFAAKRSGGLMAILTRPVCGCSVSPPSRHPMNRPKSPSTRSNVPWRWKERRAANW